MSGYRECFKQAVAAAVAGATVLTVNTRSARAIHAAVEQELRTTSAAWLSPDILPYGAFIDRLFSEAVVAGAVKFHALQREQELELWRSIIERSFAGREMLLSESAAALAAQAFRTAAEYSIALDSPQMGASSDTRAFSGWAAEFRRQLAEHCWTCAALFTRDLAPRLSELQLPAKLFVFLSQLTPAQRNFLDALAAAGAQVTVAPEYAAQEAKEASATVLRYEFDGVADELFGAARWARQQLEASPQARIGVLFFDLERKLTQVESAFRAVLHPENLLGARTPEAFEIASPVSLDEYPAVDCALRLLALFAAPIDFHAFQSMLSSPYFNLGVAPEAVARFLAEVRKRARIQVGVEDLARWLQETHELPQLRAALSALRRQAAFTTQQPVAHWADIARKILKAFGWPEGVVLSSEEFQSTESWRNLLRSVASLEALEWRTDFRGFVARLERAAANQKFKPETRNAPVQIMDLTESEGSLFDALWIGSCSDDLWPESPNFSPLIPIALLKDAGFAITGTPQAEAEIARTTARLLCSAPQVVLSLARHTDDEREQRWSPFFAGVASAAVPVADSRALALQMEPAALDAISDSKAPALGPTERARGGTSLLQDQSNCPFRAFAIRRLLAREEEGPNEALAPTERGKIVERALQLIWEELKDSLGLDRPDRAAIVVSAVDKAMAEEFPSAANAWTVRFRALERQRTINLLKEWLDLETHRKAFRVLCHQQEVDVQIAGLNLHGRIDRLDEVGDAKVVIDYKTGVPNSVSVWSVPRPRMPQLPFYAYAMLQQHDNVAGISFASLRPGECGFRGFLRDKDVLPCRVPDKRSFNGAAFDDYTALWAAEIERIATTFVQGEAEVDPKIPPGRSGSSCEHCHLSALCRVSAMVEEDANGDSPLEESDE